MKQTPGTFWLFYEDELYEGIGLIQAFFDWFQLGANVIMAWGMSCRLLVGGCFYEACSLIDEAEVRISGAMLRRNLWEVIPHRY